MVSTSKQMLFPLIPIIIYLFCLHQTSLAEDSDIESKKAASIEQCCTQVKNGACKNSSLLAMNPKIPKSCAILEPFCANGYNGGGLEYDTVYGKLMAIAGESSPNDGSPLKPFDQSSSNVLLPAASCMNFTLKIRC